MNPCELAAAVTAAAVSIASQLNDDDLSITAAALTQLGDTLNTILIQRTICSAKCKDTGSSS